MTNSIQNSSLGSLKYYLQPQMLVTVKVINLMHRNQNKHVFINNIMIIIQNIGIHLNSLHKIEN